MKTPGLRAALCIALISLSATTVARAQEEELVLAARRGTVVGDPETFMSSFGWVSIGGTNDDLLRVWPYLKRQMPAFSPFPYKNSQVALSELRETAVQLVLVPRHVAESASLAIVTAVPATAVEAAKPPSK